MVLKRLMALVRLLPAPSARGACFFGIGDFDMQRRETPDRSSGLQSLTTASGEVARKPWTSTGQSPHLRSRDRRHAGLILLRQ
jgi:hypothetical protein